MSKIKFRAKALNADYYVEGFPIGDKMISKDAEIELVEDNKRDACNLTILRMETYHYELDYNDIEDIDINTLEVINNDELECPMKKCKYYNRGLWNEYCANCCRNFDDMFEKRENERDKS